MECIVILPAQVLFLHVTCSSHSEHIVVMNSCHVVGLALCLKEYRIYIGYHAQNEGKCWEDLLGIIT